MKIIIYFIFVFFKYGKENKYFKKYYSFNLKINKYDILN